VQNLYWHGKKLDLLVTRDSITLQGSGVSVSRHYKAGKAVRLNSNQLSH
jgi:hypothetical protein